MEELDDFRKLVEECRKKRINKNIQNSAWPHALALFENLFLAVQKESEKIRIVTGNLNPEFYGKLVASAKKCLEDGHKIFLYVIEPEAKVKATPFAKLIIDHENGEFVHAITDDWSDSPHFILVGDDRFRFELDHKKTKAVANFSNKDMGSQIKDLFHSLEKGIFRTNQLALS